MTPDRPFGRIGEGSATHDFMRGYSYLRLLQAYVMGGITITELQHAYRERYLHGPEEDRPNLDEEEGHILRHMFSVLDSFTTDRKVVAQDPEFFLTEKQVRQEAILTLQKLRILNRS